MQASSESSENDESDSEDDEFVEFLAAALYGDVEVIDKLLSMGRNVNETLTFLDEQISPLHLACRQGHQEVINRLIAAKADVNISKDGGPSPLSCASQQGHQQAVRALLEAKANPDHQDSSGQSPLYKAAQDGHSPVVHLLANAQADVDKQENTGASPLYIAAQNVHNRVIDILIKEQANVDLTSVTGTTPVLIAAQGGHDRVVKLLIAAQADVNLFEKSGMSPIFIASQNGHEAVVQLLIKAQADVNLQTKDKKSPIFVAAREGHNGVVKLLADANADADAQQSLGATPMYIAAQNGHEQVVDTLIKAGANVNIPKRDAISPLYIAAQNGHDQVVEFLILAGASANAKTAELATPLIIASYKGRCQVIMQLIKAKADVNIQNNMGCTSMYYAAQEGHCQALKLLIEAHADVNLQAYDGISPLYIACEMGHREAVAVLIRAKADADLASKNGLLPIDIAKMNGRDEVLELLSGGKSEGELKDESLDTDATSLSETAGVATIDCDEQQSRELESALTKAGFVYSRAALQSAVADVLQDIMNQRFKTDALHIVGSFSEGWGNNLARVDGRTDAESDIDLMQLFPGRIYHIKGVCECSEESVELVDYDNGHIECSGFATHPATPETGSALRPAVDRVSACRICCYPPIGPLQPRQVVKSNISDAVLQSLRRELETSPCHVVHAAPPGQAGKQLRVSTTFLERRLLRSLTTLQGQLFVTLKFLVKKVIGRKVQGLKAYHAKTVTFRMLEETPTDEWKTENLVSLIRKSLQMLLNCVDRSCTADNTNGRIMEHFFLRDAGLYLKGADRSGSDIISRVLRNTIKELPKHLTQFTKNLDVLSQSGSFYFHPFLVMPNIGEASLSAGQHLQYHEIYDLVRECLISLSLPDSQESQVSLFGQIDRLPDCARSARESLKVLCCIRFGRQDEAVKVLLDCKGHAVTRDIKWPAERSANEATMEFVCQHLSSHDTAWKFCFLMDHKPKLDFLPSFLADLFPIEMQNYESFMYINFDALLQSLRFQLIMSEATDALDWTRQMLQIDDSDAQEMLVCAKYCNDVDLVPTMEKLMPIVNSLQVPLRNKLVEVLMIRKTFSDEMAANQSEESSSDLESN